MNYALSNFPFNSGLGFKEQVTVVLTEPAHTITLTKRSSEINLSPTTPSISFEGDIRYGEVKRFIKTTITEKMEVYCSDYKADISDTFTSLGNLGGVIIGQNNDGLYALTASDDEGASIDASVKTTPIDFDDEQIKLIFRLRYITDSENLQALVSVNGNDYTLDPFYAGSGNLFFRIAEPEKAQFYEIGFQNTGGEDFFFNYSQVTYIQFDR
jgi:DNA polymerase III sliding clamp (beta) subunit (PCNA family)